MAVLGYLSKLKRSLELAFEEGGGGEEKSEIQKFQYLENEKNF